MTPPDLRMTRTYYFTWQALGLFFTAAVGALLYFGIGLTGDPPDFVAGLVIGAVMTKVWNELKWKDGDL